VIGLGSVPLDFLSTSRHSEKDMNHGSLHWDGVLEWDGIKRKGKERSIATEFWISHYWDRHSHHLDTSRPRLFAGQGSRRREDERRKSIQFSEHIFKHSGQTSNHYVLLSSLLQPNLSYQRVVAGIVCMYVCTLGTESLYKNRTDAKKKVQSTASSLWLDVSHRIPPTNIIQKSMRFISSKSHPP